MKDKNGKVIATMHVSNTVTCIHCGRILANSKMTQVYSTCKAYNLQCLPTSTKGENK